jgi:hypothetical protein
MKQNSHLKIRVLSFAVLLLLTQYSFGQKSKRFKLKDIYFNAGMQSVLPQPFGLVDFKSLAPTSSIFRYDIDVFKDIPYYYYNTYYSSGIGFNNQSTPSNFSPMASAALGFNILDKKGNPKKYNPSLRMGLAYYSNIGFSAGYGAKWSYTYDQKISNNGETINMDSVTYQSIYASYTSQQIRFDVSLLYSTKSTKRVKFYTGFALNGGVSINPVTEMTEIINKRRIVYFQGSNVSEDFYGQDADSKVSKERFRNKTNYTIALAIPVGIDLSMGKKNEFWKQMYFHYEVRPGVNITAIPELRTFANGSLQHGLGFRYRLN